MQIIIDILLFLGGLVGVVKGADWLTDGGAAIARRYGISTLVIGFTIVAFGSSAPEFVVSVVSALKGNTDMAIGNVVGSNIFNILAIMGVTALVAPVPVSRGNIRHDLPFIFLSSIVIVLTILDNAINGHAENIISRSEGLLYLCFFAIFMIYTYSIAMKDKEKDKHKKDKEQLTDVMPMWKAALLVIVGLGCLVGGGELLVDGASGLASAMGLSQSIIALTIVSGGTSAPELAASVMAARKGDTAMALGNIVGSVIFNVFFVLGISATIFPLSMGNITYVDLGTLVIASALLWAFCKYGKRAYTLSRTEGTVMILLQILYYAYLIWQA